MKRCLITGGAGFIGSHLVERMVDEGWNVVVLDNLSSGKLENLSNIKKEIKFVNIDIRNLYKLKEIQINNIEVIIHLAALVSVNKSILDPKLTFDINLSGTINILELAKRLEIKKIILASSSAVYGNINKEKIKEEDMTSPLSPYGLSKLMAEETLSLYSELFGLTTTSLRFFNVYGPRQNADSPYSGVVSKFIKAFRNGGRPTVYGKGDQTRDFIYVEDLVDAIIESTGVEYGNHIYNVGTGNSISINRLKDILLNEIFMIKNKAIYKPARKGDILFSGADINKIKKELNFKPKYKIISGLKKMTKETGI